MTNPANLKYHKEHTWARIDGNNATIGITDYAQDSLGDIVYIEMPEIGATVTVGQEMSEIESTKATSPVISPVSGKIIEVNSSLEDEPEIINTDPYNNGWIAVVELEDGAELMDSAKYDAYLAEEAE
jgi:glycine cleavage system H protein